MKLRVGGLLHCGVFYFIVERNCGCGHWLCRISKWFISVEFSKMRNPCTTCFWMRYLGSMVVITSKALADNSSQTGMVLASSSHFRQSISSGSTSLSWLSFYPFNRSHAVVVAVTVNISSYCYWFHCKVLSRRVCHPYYIAPLV
ncbi:hypothetical protein AHAS_Ahas16G0041400 [Arachis hypogaea]